MNNQDSNVFGMYALYDIKAGEAGPLFIAKTDEVAVRSVCHMLNETIYPEDYRLVHLGEYDAVKMSVCSCGQTREIDFLYSLRVFREKVAEYNKTKAQPLFPEVEV